MPDPQPFEALPDYTAGPKPNHKSCHKAHEEMHRTQQVRIDQVY